MGNKIGESSGLSLMDEIQKQYEKVKQDSRGIVLTHKETQNNYLLKEYTFCTQSQFQNKKRELQELVKSGPKQYIISPIRIESNVFSSFCSTAYKIYTIFEYPQVTLKEQIIARQKQNKNFDETQLWSILQSCANALSELKPLVSLNSNEIFINPDGHLKIIHDDLIDQNFRAVLSQHVYYAPEKLKNFNKTDTQLGLRKQSIFSMGMTLLEASLLESIDSCYDYSNGNFHEQILNEMIEQLSSKYSSQFIEMLSNIVEINPNRRASLMQVQKMLQNFWNSVDQNQIETKQKESSLQKSRPKVNDKKLRQSLPLGEKCLNSEIPTKMVSDQKPKSIQMKHSKLKQRQITIPNEPSSYKLEQPKSEEGILSMTTPKNQPRQSNLYTDPKLLEMIKKDLEDIGKLKQSAFCQTSKYTYLYPQTQSILNSIRNFDTQSKAMITHSVTTQIQPFTNTQPLERQQKQLLVSNKIVDPSLTSLSKPMMKKNHNQLVFVVQDYENGRKYEGTTLNGKKHGRGKLTFEDGAYYDGEFKEDKMNGNGVLFYAQNFPAYEGQWYNDQFHGQGTLYNENPQSLNEGYDFSNMNQVQDYWVKYQGQFELDNKSGKGKLYLTNGQIFEGQFLEDCVNGFGRYRCINGQIVQGIWRQNMLSEITHSQ